jgi:hypothetical protein
MDHKSIITDIQQLSHNKYIKINTKNSIITLLKKIHDYCSNDNKLHINQFVGIINDKITSNVMSKLNKLKPIITKIINTTIVDNNNDNNNTIVDNNNNVVVISNNKLDIKNHNNTKEIEDLLDSNIYDYNKFNKDNPMKGVHFSIFSGKYRVTVGNFKSNIKILEDACMKVIEKNSFKNTLFDSENVPKFWFQYKKNFFVVYKINSSLFFDILHIFSLLNLKQSSARNKYSVYSNNIEHRLWQKNIFGGYTLRELISETTMYQLLMSSSSDFSKNFKQDVSNILVKSRSNKLLTIDNDTLQLKNAVDIPQQDICQQIIENHTSLFNYIYPELASEFRYMSPSTLDSTIKNILFCHNVPYTYHNPIKFDLINDNCNKNKYKDTNKYTISHNRYLTFYTIIYL